MRRCARLAVLIVACLCAAAASASPADALRPGERLKIGLSGGRMADEPLWLLRTVGDDGLLSMPNGHTISAAGRPRGEIEAQLMEQFGAGLVVVSRLDAGEDHGNGAAFAPEAEGEAALDDAVVPELISGTFPVGDLLDRLAGYVGYTVVVDTGVSTVLAENEPLDTGATIHVIFRSGMPLREAIEQTLAKAMQEQLARVNWIVDGRTLLVADAEELRGAVTTHVYDLHDLLANSGVNVARGEQDELIEEVIGLIRDTVEPDRWRENGGTVGAIAELNGQLVVTGYARMHRGVARTLRELRDINALSRKWRQE